MTGNKEGLVAGIGLDLVSVSRFKKALDRWGERFMQRLFTPEEIRYCQDSAKPEIHLAARFAAKEALVKALGIGFSGGITFRDVEVLSHKGSPPKIALHNRALVISVASGYSGYHLSITHSGDYAAACVVATASNTRENHE